MASNRRGGDSIARPALKVVGFRVEGVPPSPDQLHALTESTEGGGSPDPVIIPPSFQVLYLLISIQYNMALNHTVQQYELILIIDIQQIMVWYL